MSGDHTNTGDVHGTVAELLSSAHEHHGEIGHTSNAFDAYSQESPIPDSEHPAPKPSCKIMGRHATLAGMLTGSQTTINRSEHLLDNIQRLDPVSRSRLQSWLNRTQPGEQNGPSTWDSVPG